MPNRKATKRKRDAQGHHSSDKIQKVLGAVPSGLDISGIQIPNSLYTIISEEEMEVTVDTLLALAEYPSVIKSKPCKNLRAAVYDFRLACTTGVNSKDDSLTARVSGALANGKYTDALVLLAEMRIRNEAPKLGALCRWVRDLDVVSGVTIHADDAGRISVPRTKSDLEKLTVLDAILRVTAQPNVYSEGTFLSSSDPIAQQAIWNLRDKGKISIPIRESVLDKTIFDSQQETYRENFQIIETTPGAQRKPPNFHPAIIYLTSDNAISLSKDSPRISCTKHPHISSLSFIKDVLSSDECKSIVAATESIGFLPDAPIRDDGQETSILAHNVIWMIDEGFHDRLWERVRPFVPPHVDGRKARSINRRFRVYRYVPGAEYRCHIDGAWPPSGVHPLTKAYQYDSSPANAKQSSLFTFLIYLNDEFEGGETTFFIPSLRDGVMNAYPVNPVMGSVAMFPHGETRGALLHEGTGVIKGAKYVIRTEVEYDVGVVP